MSIKTNSLAFKSSVLYILLTVFVISILIVVVWENQLDLISRNTEMNAYTKSIELHSKMEKILEKQTNISSEVLDRISKEIRVLNVNDFTLYTDNGEVIFEANATKMRRQRGEINIDKERLNIYNCIYQNAFMDKVFYHDMLWDEQKLFFMGPEWSRIRYIDLYIPAGYATQTVVIRLRLPFVELAKQRTYLIRQTMLIGIIVIFLHIIFGVAIVQMIIRPISLLNRATEKIARGDLKSRVNILRDDEIGSLANSFNEMAIALQHMREADRGANPLTGLPGNISIVQEIDKRLSNNEDIAVIYADLDNFKAYNDKYGFTRGDDVILYTRDCFLEACKIKGTNQTFLGHEGGDDFVVVTPFENYESIARAIITNFDRNILQFYNETDARNGYIESVNRQGHRMRFSIISISLAVVSNHFRPFKHHAEIISVAAEMKKVVKRYEGSNFAIDKRTTA